MKWTKLLMNMMGNATLRDSGSAAGSGLRRSPTRRPGDRSLARGVDGDARAGIPPVNIGSYPFSVLAPLIRLLPNFALRGILRTRIGSARGGKLPSLHIDLHSGRPRTEIGWLNGAVVQQGEVQQIPTPINRLFTDTVRQMTGDAQKQALWQHNTTRLIVAAAEARDDGRKN